MSYFGNATVLIPATDETMTLEKTIRTIADTCKKDDLEEFFIIICEKTTEECRKTIADFSGFCKGIPIRTEIQDTPGLGGALICGMKNAAGTHIITMPADGGIDLDAPSRMIAEAKKKPSAIVTTSRWMKGCRFEGYNKIRLFMNHIAQIFLRILFLQKMTDMTNPSQIAPKEVYDNIVWESTDYNLMLEMVLKPVRMGVEFIEIPTNCHPRTEGKSGNSPAKTFAYLGTAIKIRFTPRKYFLKTIPEKSTDK